MATNATESSFVGRLAAAVRAAWWTFLIGVLFVGGQFLFYHAVSRCPAFWSWVAGLLGGSVAEETIRMMLLGFMLAIRAILVVWLLGSIFLTLWLRRLRRTGDR